MTTPPTTATATPDLSSLRIDPRQRAGQRPRRRLPWLVLPVVLAASMAAGLSGGAFPFLARELPVARVTRTFPAQVITLFTATGYVVPQTRAQVASKATGRLEAIEVREGDRVKAGQVLARVENADLEAARARAGANVTVSEAQVKASRALVSEARARLLEAQAEARDASRARKRAEQVARERFIAEQERDAAIARDEKAAAGVTAARAAIETAEAQVAIAAAQVDAARAALREAEVAVDYTVIRAPFNGVVLEKFADLGDVVAPLAATASTKGAVVTLADLDTLEVEADVSEASLLRAQVGQPAEIVFDALPDSRLRGRVRQVVPTVDRSKATVLVKVSLVDSDPRVLPEMSARVSFLSRELEFDEHAARLTVPLAAVDGSGGEPSVWRLGQDARIERVVLGDHGSLGEWQVVGAPPDGAADEAAEAGRPALAGEGGLAEGDSVLLDPPADLEPGTRVRARPPGDD